MQTQDRPDITPRPAEFDYRGDDSPQRVSLAEIALSLLSLGILAVVVVAVEDQWSRLAGVLMITGVLSAVVARRVAGARGRG